MPLKTGIHLDLIATGILTCAVAVEINPGAAGCDRGEVCAAGGVAAQCGTDFAP
jgi:hypothetical protein